MDLNSILVIGAGIAGLAAARTLAEAGRSVTVLEAAPRVGGRILTVHDGSEVIELGAEFIHGRPPELWSLIEEAGLETYELDGPTLAFDDGILHPYDEQQDATSVLDPLESLPGPDTAPDLAFAQYLAQHPELPEDLRRSSIGYVEGFNAADHRIISSHALGLQQSAEEAIDGDRLFRIRTGYSALPEFLARKLTEAGGRLHLDTLVERIVWSKGHVRVTASQAGEPASFEAAQAVIALPLGVLEHQAVDFVPLPDPVHEARRLRMGQVRRLTLLFREKFWTTRESPHHVSAPREAGSEPTSTLSSRREAGSEPTSTLSSRPEAGSEPTPALSSRPEAGSEPTPTLSFRPERSAVEKPASAPAQAQGEAPGDFSFLFSFASMPPVWWTPLPQPSRTLTGWVGGPRSEALFHLNPEQLGRLACETLAGIFNLPAGHLSSLLVRTYTHDWQTDGLFFGAYSYVPAGAFDACSKMTLPAAQTLFFAGEHTDTTGHWGTVHAALGSGLRAAQQILHS